MRITIIGHSGSGKTTLAKRISEKFGIPHLHIDRLWFEAGGNKLKPGTDGEEKKQVRLYVQNGVEKFIAQDSWISDGLYSRVQTEIATRAGTVVFIDIPLWRRLINHLVRIFPRDERHPELSLWDEFAFFPDMLRRHLAHEPKLRKVITEFKDKVVTLHSRKEIDTYFKSLER